MSVKVNLIPRDVAEREAAGRSRVLLAAAALVLIAVLGVLWFVQQQQIDDVEQRLATEQAAAAELQAELAELDEFAAIADARDAADLQVQTLMAGELEVAGVLQDVAAVMPADTELSSLTINAILDDTVGQDQVAVFGAVGRTSAEHAPGLERLLLELDKIAAFDDLAFGSAAVDNDDAVAFDVSADLGLEVLTGRYLDGLPEETP